MPHKRKVLRSARQGSVSKRRIRKAIKKLKEKVK